MKELKNKIFNSVLLLAILACSPQQDDIGLIKEFVDTCLLSNNKIDEKSFKMYLHISDENYDAKLEMVSYFIEEFQKQLTFESEYDVLPYKELESIQMLDHKIDYGNKSQVYYVIFDNDIKLFFIVDNQHIVSFFKAPTISKGRKTVEPNVIHPFIL